ncbi:efflux transporter outer membrane subunit [Pseudoduganella ginsengisoli]|uniref:Efflux transporter outer membrane subunit n=1 Tax=Pseudoduganella ginsengisoli TaxID=1462440 RepID=A0A6L6Q6P8_9BURK|nr:efflux transporter outer membrane subunit [Pseudoduganella ginsengisoli]MTW05186.1 efflux transporter outer membrane subunit [Pseudoduganella ginsengisoli]
MQYRKVVNALGMLAAASLMQACAVGPHYAPPAAEAPASFHASLPQADQRAADLRDWWRQFDDPLVAQLVDAAQATNPTLAQALARIEQARGSAGSAQGARFPELNAGVSGNRSKTTGADGVPVITTTSLRGLDASWELDLFGAKRKAADAAEARLAARTADWHAARVSLAAEVGSTLVDYRACVATAQTLEQDLGSRMQTLQLTERKVKAGFMSAADSTLINASAADARQRLVAQQANCDLNIKALVTLTGIAEQDLRAKLGASAALPQPRAIAVQSVPAQALQQRPDVEAAERELAAASADINVAEAARYPRLTLTGNVGIAGLRLSGASNSDSTWSFAPALTLPLFDAGRRRADVHVAQARYDEAYAVYRQRVQGAVREIEEALVRLDSAARRQDDAQAAARDYERYFELSNDRLRAGTGSMFELEDARRSALSARQNLIGVQRERVTAWIALYKALGGGWTATPRS